MALASHAPNPVRIAAAALCAGIPLGALNLIASAEVRAHAHWLGVIALDVLLMVAAAILLALPWRRWPDRALVAVAALGSLITVLTDVTYGYSSTNAPINGITVYIAVVGLWLGWTQTPEDALIAGFVVTAPLLAYSVAVAGQHQSTPVFGLAVICQISAAVVAWGRANERVSLTRMRTLVDATSRLDPTIAPRDVSAIVAECARHALGADHARVVVRQRDDEELDLAVRHADSPRRNRQRSFTIPINDIADIDAIVVSFDRRVSDDVIEPAIALLSGLLTQYLREQSTVSTRLRSDPLTMLGNRLAADDALEALQHGDCVVLLDIDHFKNVNDLLGHAGGDAVIRLVGAFLRTQLRSTDIVCRYGGDEFLLVLPGVQRPESIIEALMRRWADSEPVVSLSCGAAVARPDETSSSVVERADQALYGAKRAGRSRFVISDASAPDGGSPDSAGVSLRPDAIP